MQKVIFHDCRDMHELKDNSIHLVVTSPPYFNAPHDYPDLYKSYSEYLNLIKDVAKELYRVLADGRVACLVVDDMLVNGKKYPITADITKIFESVGFTYRDKILWIKPKGFIRIGRRSGVLIQHPYPMYYYPDNIAESVLIFQKGKFDYSYLKTLPKEILESSKIDTKEYNKSDVPQTVWHITNVLPHQANGVAQFPEEIPRRLITLFSFVGETVLDCFVGSGTTLKVAKELKRNSIGYEIRKDLKTLIATKVKDVEFTG
jgi:DNA modification methylase